MCSMGGWSKSKTSGMPPRWLMGVSQLGGADLCGGYAGGESAPTLVSADLMIPALGEFETEMRVILLRPPLLPRKKKA